MHARVVLGVGKGAVHECPYREGFPLYMCTQNTHTHEHSTTLHHLYYMHTCYIPHGYTHSLYTFDTSSFKPLHRVSNMYSGIIVHMYQH